MESKEPLENGEHELFIADAWVCWGSRADELELAWSRLAHAFRESTSELERVRVVRLAWLAPESPLSVMSRDGEKFHVELILSA